MLLSNLKRVKREASGVKKEKPKTALQKLVARSEVTAAPSKKKAFSTAILRTPQEDDEDAYIAYLESKLGYVKKRKRTVSYDLGDEEDGLGELLKDLDTFETSIFPNHVESKDSGSELEDAASASEGDEEDSEVDNEDVERLENVDAGSDDEDVGVDDDVDEDEEVEEVVPDLIDSEKGPPETSSAGTKYVPPHLRKAAENSSKPVSEAQVKLTRQLKGLLNRMTEQNIASIVDGVEEVYRNHRRHDVTETITKLVSEGISSHSILLDQYVVLHAAFVSALHKLIGIEFVLGRTHQVLAAFFVQHVVTSYDTHFAALKGLGVNEGKPITEEEGLGKECSNLIVLLSELYNFQVLSCVLMYDIIRSLLDGDLSEFNVELLLKVARNSGQQLRQDDPTALKSIIQIVHLKIPSDTGALSSRTRFMVETLGNLKNNKVKKAAVAGGEAVERMKKFLSGLAKKRHVMPHEPLRVSLDDLRSADTKGKWWLVGAAWTGNPLVEHQREVQNAKENAPALDTSDENVLVKLAKKQGMNTDIRRSIFMVLMSSEASQQFDYADACERLSQLNLTEVQQREIIRVILHCCGNEKQYNPYYALVGQQLCRISHSPRITLQFCLWDFLRDMGETTVGGAEILKNLTDDDRAGLTVKTISPTRARNVARAFGWWVAKDCCTLAVLKPVDFTVLKPAAAAFVRELVVHVLANTQRATPLLSNEDLPTTKNKGPLEGVFVKGAKVPALALGLVFFIRDAMKGEEGFLKWASGVALETLRTGMDIVPDL
ncbi:MIF4G-domain-containing protein [Epithele typhae]|uniref:MIF4G-domain-containing protein n=1 Tax=Epithele typhae TaxID=378194 RepID=UPI00200898F9|nr:MIF4G-domain-containing protein [Epithele typhae]KAH9945189.1 MIF4G-domain-containing protein [Epithele typhae]